MSQKHVHIEMIGGLAGDMFLAAAIDVGLITSSELSAALSKVGLGEIEVVAQSVKRYGIEATHVSFRGWDPSLERDHRHLSEIEQMIDASALPTNVKFRAISLFRTLGEVEARTHDIPVEEVHFHEIGAIDSILDFVGAAVVLERVQGSWSAGEVPCGEGMVQMSHGPMPAVAPATARLLEGFVMAPTGVKGELVTPTGATILRSLRVSEPGMRVSGKLTGVGFGAGSKDFEGRANVVRLSVFDVGTKGVTRFEREVVTQLSADIDDESAEVTAHAEQLLWEAGALDVTRHAVGMKKGRLGVRLMALCREDRAEELGEMMLRHTSTFGVRVERVERWVLGREVVEVETPYGGIAVKLGKLGEEVIKATPEYEACGKAAREHEVSVQRVVDATRAAAQHYLK